MKTLSQNTTSSACAPETGLQQLVATIVPDEQRISFWPQHFSLIPQWVTLEHRDALFWCPSGTGRQPVALPCRPRLY